MNDNQSKLTGGIMQPLNFDPKTGDLMPGIKQQPAAPAPAVSSPDLSALTDEEREYVRKCPISVSLFVELDSDKEPSRRKFPAHIYADFLPTQDTHVTKYHGVLEKYSTATVTTLLDGWKICPAETLNELQSVQSELDALGAEVEKWSLLKVSEKFRNQRSSDAPARSQDEIFQDHLMHLRGLEEKAKPLSVKAAELSAAVIQNAQVPVRAFMLELESSERDRATEFSLAWAPSNLWRVCAAILIHFSGRTPQRLALLGSPRAMLNGFVQI